MKILILTTILLQTGCASMKTVEETKDAIPKVFKLVEQKNLAEALTQLKAIGYCDNPATIGSNCGAWKIAYELEGEPVLYRTIDERGGAYPNTGGDEKLKNLVRLMSSISECSKITEKEKMESCLEGKVVDRTYYTSGAKDRFNQFKTFICGSGQHIKPGGWSHSTNNYSASEVFVLKSEFGKAWAPVKIIVSSEMCKVKKPGADE